MSAAVILTCAECRSTFAHEGRGRRPSRCPSCRGVKPEAAKPTKVQPTKAKAPPQQELQSFEDAVLRLTGAMNGLAAVLEKVLREAAW